MFEKKELVCFLCYSKYGTGFPQRIPRNLDCKHTFCTDCIKPRLVPAYVNVAKSYVNVPPSHSSSYVDVDKTYVNETPSHSSFYVNVDKTYVNVTPFHSSPYVNVDKTYVNIHSFHSSFYVNDKTYVNVTPFHSPPYVNVDKTYVNIASFHSSFYVNVDKTYVNVTPFHSSFNVNVDKTYVNMTPFHSSPYVNVDKTYVNIAPSHSLSYVNVDKNYVNVTSSHSSPYVNVDVNVDKNYVNVTPSHSFSPIALPIPSPSDPYPLPLPYPATQAIIVHNAMCLLLECPEHKDKLKFYCRTCNALCCAFCQLYGTHTGHSCFEVHEAEERERQILENLQSAVDKQSEKYIKARGDVQRIEEVKQGCIIAKDTARRYYRELKAAIEQGEQLLMQDISKRSESKLKALNEQVSHESAIEWDWERDHETYQHASQHDDPFLRKRCRKKVVSYCEKKNIRPNQMIEISSLSKTASRNCNKALALDYYEMLTRKSDVEREIREVLDLTCETSPVAQANLKCQFPNHEALVNNIKTCAKLVVPPGPPEKLSCKVTEDKNVLVKWNPPETNFSLYPVVGYVLQCST
ncbi:hypothetical protein QZH41_016025, partial [Actinostola sp. cb2023]